MANNEETILNDPTTSKWLKEQIYITKSRDVVDCLNDAERLIEILKSRFEAIQTQEE